MPCYIRPMHKMHGAWLLILGQFPPNGGQVILRVILHGHTCPLTATSPFQQASCAFNFSRSKPPSTTKHSSGRTLSPGDPRPVFFLSPSSCLIIRSHPTTSDTSDHFRYIELHCCWIGIACQPCKSTCHAHSSKHAALNLPQHTAYMACKTESMQH